MSFKIKAAATILAVTLAASFANASDKDPAAKPKKHATAMAKKPVCDACDQIQALKTEMQTQIDAMKQDLAAKDAELQAAKKAAADAQAAADRANAAVSAQNQAVTDNASAVTTMQTTITDLKANATSLANTVSDETASIKKAINSPDTLHYKGITMTPYGFANGESVYRTHATGGGPDSSQQSGHRYSPDFREIIYWRSPRMADSCRPARRRFFVARGPGPACR